MTSTSIGFLHTYRRLGWLALGGCLRDSRFETWLRNATQMSLSVKTFVEVSTFAEELGGHDRLLACPAKRDPAGLVDVIL